MRIEKYIKQRNGQYKITFEDGSNILLHEDLILKYELLINKELTEKKLDELISENELYVSYDLALSYLNKKMRTSKEIKEYLKKKETKDDFIVEVINMLNKQGYLNDDVYCKSFINDRINLSNDGPHLIKEKLLKLGLKEEIIEKYIIIFDEDLEKDRIMKLINKQIKTNHNKSNMILKKKIIDNLINLGYTRSNIISEIEKVSIDDQNIKEKEYRKIYDKLSKKYSGKELEYKIKQKMYQKGFYDN